MSFYGAPFVAPTHSRYEATPNQQCRKEIVALFPGSPLVVAQGDPESLGERGEFALVDVFAL